jgi:hypothetical protein
VEGCEGRFGTTEEVVVVSERKRGRQAKAGTGTDPPRLLDKQLLKWMYHLAHLVEDVALLGSNVLEGDGLVQDAAEDGVEDGAEGREGEVGREDRLERVRWSSVESVGLKKK